MWATGASNRWLAETGGLGQSGSGNCGGPSVCPCHKQVEPMGALGAQSSSVATRVSPPPTVVHQGNA